MDASPRRGLGDPGGKMERSGAEDGELAGKDRIERAILTDIDLPCDDAMAEIERIQLRLRAIDDGVPIDLVQIDLTRAWELLGEIIGESVQEDLINQLFSQFCLGK